MLEQIGFVDVVIGSPVDTFGGAPGEANARTFEVYGYAFLARKRADDAPGTFRSGHAEA
jgi:hypothetical protein